MYKILWLLVGFFKHKVKRDLQRLLRDSPPPCNGISSSSNFCPVFAHLTPKGLHWQSVWHFWAYLLQNYTTGIIIIFFSLCHLNVLRCNMGISLVILFTTDSDKCTVPFPTFKAVTTSLHDLLCYANINRHTFPLLSSEHFQMFHRLFELLCLNCPWSPVKAILSKAQALDALQLHMQARNKFLFCN